MSLFRSDLQHTIYSFRSLLCHLSLHSLLKDPLSPPTCSPPPPPSTFPLPRQRASPPRSCLRETSFYPRKETFIYGARSSKPKQNSFYDVSPFCFFMTYLSCLRPSLAYCLSLSALSRPTCELRERFLTTLEISLFQNCKYFVCNMNKCIHE